MSLKFSDLDLGSLQAVLYPIIEILTGVDIGKHVELQADTAFAIRDCLNEAAEIFDAAGLGMVDGHLSSDEINAVVEEATDMPEAARKIIEAIKDLD